MTQQNSDTLRINIFQPIVRAYRTPLFESMTRKLGWRCTIYVGALSHDAGPPVGYKIEPVIARKLFGLNIQNPWGAGIAPADVTIVGLDLHWPMPILHSLLKGRRSTTLLWGHGLGRFRLAARIKVWLISRYAGVIVYSERGRLNLLTAGVRADKIFVAPNTMHTPNHEDTSGQQKEHFLFVGRLQERKELPWLIAAFARYRTAGGKLSLRIVGDGFIQEELKALASSLQLDQSVIFSPGTSDDSELKAVFAKAVAYVSPGALGLGVLHAFSYGVPVVTMRERSHGPEADWLVHDHSGMAVTPSVEALADVLTVMEAPAVHTRMGANAYRTYIEDAHPDKMIDGFRRAVEHARGTA